MCRYRLCFLVTGAGNTNFCQGWIPPALPRNILQSPSFARVPNSRWSFSSTSRSVGLAIPQRVIPVVMMATSGKSQDHDQQPQERPERPTAKIIDTPIPDYLIEMLKEAGEIDDNGKPLNDNYDPNDDDQFGSKRMREHNTEEQEDYFDVPYGEMLYGRKEESTQDAGTLMDTTINSAVIEYGFPLEFFLDMLCRWGVTPPINPNVRLGDIIDAEQAAGLCEALTGLDPADVRDNYLDDTLEDLAYELDLPLPDILQACAAQKINLPQGGDTHITIDEYKLLIDNIIEGGELSPTRRLFDESRMSYRWVGQKDAEVSLAFQEETARMIEKNNRGFGWTNGPPILGPGKGELPIDAAHIGGRIFGEDAFIMPSEEEKEDDDMAEIFGFEPE